MTPLIKLLKSFCLRLLSSPRYWIELYSRPTTFLQLSVTTKVNNKNPIDSKKSSIQTSTSLARAEQPLPGRGDKSCRAEQLSHPKKLCVHCRKRSGERISSPLLGIFPTFSAWPQKCGGCRVGPRHTHYLCPTAPSSRPATTALLLRTGLPLHGFSAHKYITVPGSFPQTSEGNLPHASRSAFPLALPRETCARQWWERASLRDSNQLPSPSSTLMG